jgi:uncharacterized membrane protein YjjP (DUF1212 family)
MQDSRPAEAFIVDLGRALHRYGASTARIEAAMTQLAVRLGINAHFFVQPTALFASFGRGGAETYLLRLEPPVTDLTRLARLDALLMALLRREYTAPDGQRVLEEILRERRGRRWTPVLFGGHMLAAAAAARFVGGGWREIAVAAAIGLLVGVLARLTEKRPGFTRIQLPVTAVFASFLAMAAAAAFGPLNPQVAMLAGLVVLLPGLALTVALSELATNHLASGTARAAGAMVVFVAMAFGVALGARIAALVFGAVRLADPVPAPAWTLALAVLLAPVAMSALFRVPRREVPFVVAGCAMAFLGGLCGGRVLGPELGVFVGGFLAGVAANGYARLRNRPSAIVYLPALLMLVPGSIGFRSVTALLADQVTSGIETAFTTLLMAVALGTGMLVAGVFVPPRRVL